MSTEPHLLILGASARAAAFSALRAGLRPWCADLFADADLRARCPVVAVPAGSYPGGLVEVARQAPPGPWMYTGALENRPELVEELSRSRPLWGNGAAVLRRVRSPQAVAALLDTAGIACPAVRPAEASIPSGGRWLIKPCAGAGGVGIRFWTGAVPRSRRRQTVYLQEFIEGEPCTAVYVGDGRTARLVGITRQLVGEAWLNAAPFRYCGSIGPLHVPAAAWPGFERLGAVLAAGFGLRGLFGVDCILRDGIPWPVEVNPRYPASVEVLEYALGVPALALHCQAFVADRAAPPPAAPPPGVVGKAILFARSSLVFPKDGPWMASLRRPADAGEMPEFADIPPAGQPIRAGRPILTFFARADTPAGCCDTLEQIAKDLDRWLFQ
ncbi:MAG TPA: ATP-grasp domain-containing protein [Gemmataceae bacterium]|nr:ATP-grasp domain-containing protein [Gemmataceae bacterium]